MERDPVAADDEQREDGHDERRADQAQLLADDGEDAVVVLLGQEEELLPALAETETEETSRADGDEALARLIARARLKGVVERVEPDGDARGVVGDQAREERIRHRRDTADADADPVAADAADEHHRRADAENEHGAGKVRLEVHQHRNEGKDKAVGQDTVAECSHFVLLFGDAVGKIKDDAKLGDLRRLKPHRGARDTEPARRAVARDTDAGNDDRDEQGDGNAQRDLGHAAEARVVDAPDDDHGGKAERGKGRLPLKVVQRVARLIIGGWKARREQHDEPHAGEQQHEQEKRHIDGSAARLLRSGLHALHVLALLAPQLALLLRHTGSPPPIVF